MRKLLPAFLLLAIAATWNHANAQNISDSTIANYLAEAKKDAAFQKFQNELTGIRAKAIRHDSNSSAMNNFSAVKTLFKKNAALFAQFRKNAGLPAANPVSNTRKRYSPVFLNRSKNDYPKNIFIPSNPDLIISNYDAGWWRGCYILPVNFNSFDSMWSNSLSGGIHLRTPDDPYWAWEYLGLYAKGFRKSVQVPNDPKIVGAKVTFEFNYFYTGYDTYNSKTGLDLIIRTSSNFTGQAYESLPDASFCRELNLNDYTVRPWIGGWKKLATLMPLDSIMTDWGDFMAGDFVIKDHPVTLEGFVTPGSRIDLDFGCQWPYQARTGLFTFHHELSFRLSRIKISWIKKE